MNSGDVRDIIIGIATSVVWLMIGVSLRVMQVRLLERRPVARIWGTLARKGTVMASVATLGVQDTGEYARPMAALGELHSVVAVRQSLFEAFGSGKQLTLYFSEDFPSSALAHDLVLLGGTDHNKATRAVLSEYALPIGCFDTPRSVVINERTGHMFEPEIRQAAVMVDFGVLSRLPNPFQHGRATIVADATHTFGVAGATRLLTKEFSKDLSASIRRNRCEYWQAVVRTRVEGLQVFPELVSFEPLTLEELKAT